MARLHRPHIPISVRVEVAERQCNQIGWTRDPGAREQSAEKWLKAMLRVLFGDYPCELHHRPALVNRRRYVRNGKVFYDPPANDPAHLVYLAEDDHDIETRVRGVGAQRSDLGQRRYDKNVVKNRAKIPPGKASGFPKRSSRTKRRASTQLRITAITTGKIKVGDKIIYPDGHEGRVHFIPKRKRKWASRPFERRT